VIDKDDCDHYHDEIRYTARGLRESHDGFQSQQFVFCILRGPDPALLPFILLLHLLVLLLLLTHRDSRINNSRLTQNAILRRH
jgi:hypothetical protein